MESDWIDISLYTYNLVCDKCLSNIEIIQIGNSIDESLFPEIVNIVHKKNTFDSYTSYRYLEKEDRWIKVNIDIKNCKCKSR